MSEQEIIQNQVLEEVGTSSPGMPDPLLVFLVNQIEQVNGEVGITLWVQGGIISGKLISLGQYMRRSMTALKRMQHTSLAAERVFLDGVIDAFETQSATRPAHTEVDAQGPLPQYLQLQNAVLIAGEATRSLGAVWRGRIDAINAWMLGNVTRGG
jgi:hypothetical protein